MRSGEDRARVAEGKGGGLKPGQAAVLLPPKKGRLMRPPSRTSLRCGRL